MSPVRRFLAAALLAATIAAPIAESCHGQSGRLSEGGAVPDDHALMRAVYGWNGPPVRAVFGVVDRSAYPVSFGMPAALAAARMVEGDGLYGDGWRAGLSVAAATGLGAALKHLVRRERPFRTVDGIQARTGFVGARRIDRFSFPSGHAAMSSALAVSIALDHPKWYVIGPASAWAVAVGTSRVWLGVHFPGDVVAGWVLGAVVGWGVHALRREITPAAWDGRSP